MYKQNAALFALLSPVIQSMGYVLWGIEHLPRGRSSLLRVYIDKDSGITLTDCELVSQQVTGILDVNDPIRGQYDLEVSSPGFDRPLFTLEQAGHYTGMQVKLRLRAKVNGRRNLKGELRAVLGDAVQIVDNGETIEVPADIIEKANLQQ